MSTRRYTSPLRDAQVARTRERIVDAGVAAMRAAPMWDFRALTVKGVAERAEVSERTVYRHFASERDLHDAIIRRFEQEAGIALDDIELAHLPDLVRRLFGFFGSFAHADPTPNPTVDAIDSRRREAIRAAVEEATPAWDVRDREIASAVIDALWTMHTYQRLAVAWNLPPADAADGAAAIMQMLIDRFASGPPPWR